MSAGGSRPPDTETDLDGVETVLVETYGFREEFARGLSKEDSEDLILAIIGDDIDDMSIGEIADVYGLLPAELLDEEIEKAVAEVTAGATSESDTMTETLPEDLLKRRIDEALLESDAFKKLMRDKFGIVHKDDLAEVLGLDVEATAGATSESDDERLDAYGSGVQGEPGPADRNEATGAGTGVLTGTGVQVDRHEATGGADSDDLDAYGTGVEGEPGPADRLNEKGGE